MTTLIIMPLVLEILMVLAISLVIAFIGFLIFRKKFSHEILAENHIVGSYIFNGFSVTYGVLIAFVVYANWFGYEKAQQNVTEETTYLSNFYRDTRILPDSVKSIVTDKLIKYTEAVVEDEWPLMAKGETSPKAMNALDDLWDTYSRIPVSKITNTYFYQVSIEKLNLVSMQRRLRILDMNQTTPEVIWIVIVLCAFISVSYSYFFTTKKRKAHLFLIASLIVINVSLFYLIYVLDHPYQGYATISPEPFKLILNKFVTGL
ncbi:MAG TPA: DUF4239 domain-containing protein [Ignavibacteria bacterium]